MSFFSEHFFFRPFGAFAFLSADLFDPLLFLTLLPFQQIFYLICEQTACYKSIEGLGTLLLTFHFDTGWQMLQIYARGCLIYVLSAMTARTDEFLRNIFFTNAELLHPLRQRGFFFFTHSKHRHCNRQGRSEERR